MPIHPTLFSMLKRIMTQERVYKETEEAEMNIWVMMTGVRNPLVLFTVTVIRRECDERHPSFRRCEPATEVTTDQH